MAKDNLLLKRKLDKGDDGYRAFSIRGTENTVAWLDDSSAQTNRSRNELINIFLNYAMDHCIVEEDTKK